MKPEIILFCEGGIIQSISANTDVKIIYLDNDIFEDSDLEREGNEFHDRDYQRIHIETDPWEWKKFKEAQEKDWNDELFEALNNR